MKQSISDEVLRVYHNKNRCVWCVCACLFVYLHVWICVFGKAIPKAFVCICAHLETWNLDPKLQSRTQLVRSCHTKSSHCELWSHEHLFNLLWLAGLLCLPVDTVHVPRTGALSVFQLYVLVLLAIIFKIIFKWMCLWRSRHLGILKFGRIPKNKAHKM